MKVIQKKICLLGDFAVGKTSLVRRFVEGRFDDRYLSTIGVKVSRKSLERPAHTLNLLVWDLAGGDDFTNAQASYLKGAAGALIVCDLTRHETLAAFARYAHQMHAVNPMAALFFVANKHDLTAERAISESELQAECAALGGGYLLTSAKSGTLVNEVFERLASAMEATP